MASRNTNWPTEHLNYLKANYNHLTAVEIGEYVGRSRNAVIGMAGRIGLSQPHGLSRDRRPSLPKPPKREGRGNRGVPAPKVMVVKQPPQPSPKPITLMELEWQHCREIVKHVIGDPDKTLYCGQMQERGSYCWKHGKKNYSGTDYKAVKVVT